MLDFKFFTFSTNLLSPSKDPKVQKILVDHGFKDLDLAHGFLGSFLQGLGDDQDQDLYVGYDVKADGDVEITTSLEVSDVMFEKIMLTLGHINTLMQHHHEDIKVWIFHWNTQTHRWVDPLA